MWTHTHGCCGARAVGGPRHIIHVRHVVPWFQTSKREEEVETRGKGREEVRKGGSHMAEVDDVAGVARLAASTASMCAAGAALPGWGNVEQGDRKRAGLAGELGPPCPKRGREHVRACLRPGARSRTRPHARARARGRPRWDRSGRRERVSPAGAARRALVTRFRETKRPGPKAPGPRVSRGRLQCRASPGLARFVDRFQCLSHPHALAIA